MGISIRPLRTTPLSASNWCNLGGGEASETMPCYVVILNVNGREHAEALFEANDDIHAATEYPKNIPGTLNGVQHQLSYRRCEFDALQYQPRMARPQLGTSSYINMPGSGPLYVMAENAQPQLPHDQNSLASSVNQLALLIGNIRGVFTLLSQTRTTRAFTVT